MLEALQKIRATAYLKLIRADIWTVPPRMLSAAQNWIVSAYASSVAALAKYELTLQIDAIKEAQAIADQMNALTLNIHKILEGMQINEAKDIPINFLYHDKYKWYARTTMSITKLDKDSFKLIIQGDDKNLYSNPLISKHEAIDEIVNIADELLEAIHDNLEKSNIVDIKSLYVAAQKLSGEQTVFSDSIGTTLPFDLTDWPYLTKIAKINRNFLQKIYNSNLEVKDQLTKAIPSLKDLGNKAGPFELTTPRNIKNTILLMVNDEGGIDVSIKSTDGSDTNKVYSNMGEVLASLEVFYLEPFEDYLASPTGQESVDNYINEEFPEKSKLNIVYENSSPDKYNGLWDPRIFTIYVRPLYLNPMEAATKTGAYALDLFNSALIEMKGTIRHELQHFSQTLTSMLISGNMNNPYGLPSNKTAPFEKGTYELGGAAKNQVPQGPLLPHETREDASYGKSGIEGDVPSTTMLNHPLRDVEYQTRLADEIANFKSISKVIPINLRNRAIKIWIGEINEPLLPFSDKTTWLDYSARHRVGSDFVLDFLIKYKIYAPNLENFIRNTINHNKDLAADKEKYKMEMKLMGRINKLVRPSVFFTALHQIIRTDQDVSDSRWAKAVGSFIKEVS